MVWIGKCNQCDHTEKITLEEQPNNKSCICGGDIEFSIQVPAFNNIHGFDRTTQVAIDARNLLKRARKKANMARGKI